MECYEKTYPEKPVKVVLIGTRSEFKGICNILTDYAALTRKNKTVDRYIEIFWQASSQPIPFVLLAQKEAQQFYVYIEKYAEIKKKVKNHNVHKLLKAFAVGLSIW